MPAHDLRRDEAGTPDDGGRRRLFRNRALATLLLCLAAAAFVATYFVPAPGFGVLLVRAAAEAGVVGGLADWFAITALFRRPLGLPLPHTAIIPSNQARIGNALGRFLERHFLTEEVLIGRLQRAKPGRRIAGWLTAPGTASAIAGVVVGALPYLIHSLQTRDFHRFLRRTLGEPLGRADIAPPLARAIRLLATSGEADVLFERAVDIAARWLDDNKAEIETIVQQRSRWWVPSAVDRRIAAAIISGAAELLQRLRTPGSEARLRFHEALLRLADDLVTSPDQRARVNAAKDRLLRHPEVQAWLASLWDELSARALADAEAPDSQLRAAVGRGIVLVGDSLARDAAMQGHVDNAVLRAARYLIGWRGEIGTFVADVVKSWETRGLVDRLELVVGSDLQYIRMNGTIVGALAGCALFLISQFLPH